MKRIIYIIPFLLLTSLTFGQQFPLMEGYNVDPFHLSPAYAGVNNPRTIILDHRTDWAGIQGGPKTYQLSYHDRFFEKVGVGARFIYDKTDIFKQIMFLTTYSYEVSINEEHLINFALSIGFFNNSINLAEYYNDPDFIDDLVLTNGNLRSKIKFTSDASALYRWDKLEAGIYFSNLMFGAAGYTGSELTYEPLLSYLAHAAYKYDIDEKWSVKPYLVLRGGQNVPVQFEVMGHVNYTPRIWGNLLYRQGGVWGIGFGGEIYNGILLNYSYNMNHNVALNTFGGHQISMIFRLSSFFEKTTDSVD